jgi:hypothetical protein
MPALGGEWPQTADSNRLTVDLGDVESRARLQQAIEVEEEIALALELEVDSIVGEDARANPLLKLAGQKYNGAKLVGSPNQSACGRAPAAATSRRRRSRTRPAIADDPRNGAGRGRAPGLPCRRSRGRGRDPGALLPRLHGVVVQPAPDRRRRRVADPALNDQPVQLATRKAGKRQAGASWAARRRVPLPPPPARGGKRRGRPERSRSSSPASRCSKKRFRQRPTTSAVVSSLRAISALLSPSAA